MLNVLIAADFPILKTGVVSTASSILSEDVWGPMRIYSDQKLCINGISALTYDKLGADSIDLVFTNAEYSGLPALQSRFPEAIFHVGDWPLRHWDSLRRFHAVKSILGKLRSRFRLGKIDKGARLAFVAYEDWVGAVSYGFIRAIHLPIGVKPPHSALAGQIDVQCICFSGNLRYPPNRDAVFRLLKLTQTHFPTLRVILVGYYADDFAQQVAENVEIHADVVSVIEFLAVRRPIYLSLVETGAGAKNKILEAMVAGCPIICTPESLDASIKPVASIKIVSCEEEIVSYLNEFISGYELQTLQEACDRLALDTKMHRSWHAVAKMLRDQITTRKI